MIEKQLINGTHTEKNQLTIFAYVDEWKHHFKALNYAWLEKYFRVEEGDKITLSNPKEHIIDKGGFIFFARRGDAVVGTAALIRKSDAVFELGKMAVTPNFRESGIGSRLLDHCIRFARQRAVEELLLYSNNLLLYII
jgi:N-acetylglutamate synthase-like GNAT family acetyltransferase